MRRILLLFLFAFPFFASAQTITATCKKLNVEEETLDETHPATITITITDKQPDPGHYTLEGKYFVTICINDKANPNKTIYFNALDKNSKVKYVPAEYILGLPSSNIFLFTGIYEEPIMLYTANGSLLVAGFNEQLYVIEYPYPVIWNEFLKVAMESIDAKEQTDKTKIEPYQSNSKNKMIYNGIIVAEDNEIYEGGFVPVFIELEKKKQSNTGTDNIIVKIKDRGTSELYYHGEFNKDSKLVVKKDYLLIKGNSGSSSLEVKNNEDWDFVIETSLMTGKILKKHIIAIEDATQEDFSSIISFFKQ